MRSIWLGLTIAGLTVAAGCATTPETAQTTNGFQVVKADNLPYTGSRLQKATTERLLKSVGNREYNETTFHTSISNQIKPGGN